MPPSRLQSEIGKRNPFASLTEEAYLNLVRTNDRLQIEFTRLFRQFGLTPSQYNILRILRGEGAPLPILEIARRTVTMVPGITGLIDRLEKVGLVQRKRCQRDRRIIFVELAEAGRKVLGDMDPHVSQTLDRLFAHFEAGELRELIRLLEKAREPLSHLGVSDPESQKG